MDSISKKRARAKVATLRVDEQLTDDELVLRARAGDQIARALLFRRHAPVTLNFACRLLGDGADADDLVQDTFVRAFERLDDLISGAAFGGWVRQIALREAHRRFRRARLLARIGLAPAPGPFLSPLRADLQAELREVERVLRGLPERAAIAWLAMRVEGLTLDEVSAALSCSRTTIKRDLVLVQEALDARLAEGKP